MVGGLAFPTVWAVTLGVAYTYHDPPSLNPKALAFVACAKVAIIGFNIVRRHAPVVERYAIREQVFTISEADWLGGAWQRLSAYWIDLTGGAVGRRSRRCGVGAASERLAARAVDAGQRGQGTRPQVPVNAPALFRTPQPCGWDWNKSCSMTRSARWAPLLF